MEIYQIMSRLSGQMCYLLRHVPGILLDDGWMSLRKLTESMRVAREIRVATDHVPIRDLVLDVIRWDRESGRHIFEINYIPDNTGAIFIRSRKKHSVMDNVHSVMDNVHAVMDNVHSVMDNVRVLSTANALSEFPGPIIHETLEVVWKQTEKKGFVTGKNGQALDFYTDPSQFQKRAVVIGGPIRSYLLLDLQGAMAAGCAFSVNDKGTLSTNANVPIQFLRHLSRLPRAWRDYLTPEALLEKSLNDEDLINVVAVLVTLDDIDPLPEVPAGHPIATRVCGLPSEVAYGHAVVDCSGAARIAGCVFKWGRDTGTIVSDRPVPARFVRRVKTMPKAFLAATHAD
jgi:RNA 2'-phosphotransferase, Tpt1 / KptA family